MGKGIYFKCYKCGHYVWVYREEVEKIFNLPNIDCPECGEEGFENWIVLGEKEIPKEDETKELYENEIKRQQIYSKEEAEEILKEDKNE